MFFEICRRNYYCERLQQMTTIVAEIVEQGSVNGKAPQKQQSTLTTERGSRSAKLNL